MKRDFKTWQSQFKKSIADYKYYVDFDKVYQNVSKFKDEISSLNSLIGSNNIEDDFKSLIQTKPQTLSCIPLLLALRSKEVFVKDDIEEFLFRFDKMNYSIDDYVKFMKESGLFDLLQNHIVNNLYDYALGVEVGLDSNGRKNRGGHLMENLVESYIQKAGFIKNQTYFKEITTDQIKKKFNLDILLYISDSSLNKKIAKKRFDFVIVKNNHYYLIETNFYASNGSKLNETARSYKMLAQELSGMKEVTFIWITDGTGWNSAKGNLEETFNELDTIYNINELENGMVENIND